MKATGLQTDTFSPFCSRAALCWRSLRIPSSFPSKAIASSNATPFSISNSALWPFAFPPFFSASTAPLAPIPVTLTPSAFAAVTSWVPTSFVSVLTFLLAIAALFARATILLGFIWRRRLGFLLVCRFRHGFGRRGSLSFSAFFLF